MGGRILLEVEGSGRVYGQLTVLCWAGKTARNHRLWECLCTCGNKTYLEMSALTAGKVKSCGCLRHTQRGSVTHGAKVRGASPLLSRTFHIWSGMLQRCNNPTSAAYHRYGGRGISVDPYWSLFENFLADMGECPKGFSIERLENDDDYRPGNCAWIPRSSQKENTSKTIRVGYANKVWCLKRLCEHLEIAYMRTYKRFRKGVPLNDALDLAPNTVKEL